MNSIHREERVVGIGNRQAWQVCGSIQQFRIRGTLAAHDQLSLDCRLTTHSKRCGARTTDGHTHCSSVASPFSEADPIHITPEAIVLATKPCTATCVIDGIAVTLTFFPDTGVLRITDGTGSRLRETRWSASWQSLVATFRELSETPVEERADPDVLFGSYYRAFAMSGRYAN